MESRKDVVLVTGGAGFIGSHVASGLVKMGCDVVVLDDLSGGYPDNVPAGARFVEGSILDDALLDRMFEEFRFGCVFHLAAYAAEGLSHFVRSFNYLNESRRLPRVEVWEKLPSNWAKVLTDASH